MPPADLLAPGRSALRRLAEGAAFLLLLAVGWLVLLVWFRARVRNRGRMPRAGPVIVVSNHRSYLDPYALHSVTSRRLRYLMTHEYYEDRRLRWFYDSIGCIPVGGSHTGEQALERAVAALEQGQVIAIFPEGGVAADGRMQTFRRGAAVLAYRSGAPMVPVFIAGTHEALPKGRWLPRPRRITVLVGEPLIVPRAPAGEVPRGALEELTRELQRRVAALGSGATHASPASQGRDRAEAPSR